MALTLNRPDYTATQLNTAFTNVRTALAAVLPARILTVTGTSNFTALDIYDAGEFGGSVISLDDAIGALVDLANTRNAGFFTFNHDHSIGAAGAHIIEVYGLVDKPTLNTLNRNIGRSPEMERRTFIDANPKSVSLSAFTGTASSTFGSPGELPLYARVYYFSSGGTNMSYSFDTDGGLSDAPSNALGGYEVFTDKGYNEWFAGVSTTINIASFSTLLMGYDNWNIGTGTTIGNTEYFECGWSEGVSPIVVGVTRIEENITSQINGSTTSFSTERPFKKGTLQAIWNGQVQYEGTISETSSSTFTSTFTPSPGDVLIITYEQLQGGINRISFY